MSRKGVYAAYDLDGTEVCRGTLADMSRRFKLKERSITKMMSLDVLIHKRYSIKRIAWTGATHTYHVVKKPSEIDNYEYLKTNLLCYGNTGCTFDPIPYLPKLYDDGLNCRVKERDLSHTSELTGKHRKKKDIYYVLEVVS